MNSNDIPLAYQRGVVEFYKLKFKVNSDCLIPRPETELLVDEVLAFKPKTVLDVGTGSGNIAISIAKNLPDVKVIATEVPPEALEVAKQNAKLHHVTNQIQFVVSDLLDDVEGQFDAIVTNLPYIPSQRIPYLDSSVKDFEPRVALDGGEDGFELYRKLFSQIVKKNILPKLIICEIDYTHKDIAQNEAYKYFPKASTEVKYDLARKIRILKITFSPFPY